MHLYSILSIQTNSLLFQKQLDSTCLAFTRISKAKKRAETHLENKMIKKYFVREKTGRVCQVGGI